MRYPLLPEQIEPVRVVTMNGSKPRKYQAFLAHIAEIF
jgi:hypothetical protein